VRERERWKVVVEDQGSTNGCYDEGVRKTTFEIAAGSHFAFGSVQLIAYNAEMEDLRQRLVRYLGHGADDQQRIDDVLYAAMKRRHLVLVAPPSGGAIAIARHVHRAVVAGGETAPFVVVRRALKNADKEARALHTVAARGATAVSVEQRLTDNDQVVALAKARGGTLVIPTELWPRNASPLRERLSQQPCPVRLVAIAADGVATSIEALLGAPLREAARSVVIPPLAGRELGELQLILQDAVAEISNELGATRPALKDSDWARLAQGWIRDHDELDDVLRRLIQVRLYGPKVAGEQETPPVSVEAICNWIKRHGFAPASS